MEFYWVSADEISDLEIYPDNCKKFLLSHDGGLRHFIYKEKKNIFRKVFTSAIIKKTVENQNSICYNII